MPFLTLQDQHRCSFRRHFSRRWGEKLLALQGYPSAHEGALTGERGAFLIKARTRPAETRRFREKRAAILDAGARLFNQHGVKGTTLNDIANAVGMATTSVTYYYPSKEDLAAACLLASTETIIGLVRTAREATTLDERVRRLFSSYLVILASIENREHAEVAMFNDIRSLTGARVRTCFDAYTNMFREFRELLRPFAGATRMEENSRTHLILSLFVAIKLLTPRYHVEDYKRLGDCLSNVVLGGIFAKARWPDDCILPGAPPSGEKEASSESFLRAATMLINDQGYLGASVDKICAYLNVTKGSFYHYNDNKDDVVAACFARSFDIIRSVQNEAVGRHERGADRLATIAASLAANQLRGHGPLLRIFSAWNALPDEVRYDVETSMNRQTQRFASIITDGQYDGSVKTVDPLVAAHAVSIMINAAAEIERWVAGITTENVVDLYVRPLFFGLARSAKQSASP